jgi:hypothetical protein
VVLKKVLKSIDINIFETRRMIPGGNERAIRRW